MASVDVLVVTALKGEFEAAQAALEAAGSTLQPCDVNTPPPYFLGTAPGLGGTRLSIALTRSTRMGANATSPVASSLVERLRPKCLAMCGVCAGNPANVALGDVIVAEIAYAYDEGKQKKEEFEGDQRQIPLDDRWVRAAQDLSPTGLYGFGEPSAAESESWLLEQLSVGYNPMNHPARRRYISDKTWENTVRSLEQAGLIRRERAIFHITDKGRDAIEQRQAYVQASPTVLPYKIHVGPVASGNVVVKDGITWDTLRKAGVRTVIGLEMEAAAIAHSAHRLNVPNWLVVKGVMDYADPNKDDRFKSFAARASAHVLLRLLEQLLPHSPEETLPAESAMKFDLGKAVNIVGDVNGNNININQICRNG